MHIIHCLPFVSINYGYLANQLVVVVVSCIPDLEVLAQYDSSSSRSYGEKVEDR